MTLFAYIIGPNFYKYNLRPIDREVSRKLKMFETFANDVIKETVDRTKRNEKSDP